MKIGYFSKREWALWSGSMLFIIVAFVVFDRQQYVTLSASLVGVTSLIFNAKGNPFGQVLMILFSVLYGIISFSFAYYGEMITYLGMTAPMAAVALIAWLRHPYQGNRAQVKVNRIAPHEIVGMFLTALVVTAGFYYLLKYFHTSNLLPSTLSVTTSFIAAYLTFRRSPYFALAYVSNDVVLIVLWILACQSDLSYVSVVVCFLTFLINDVYGFLNWKTMEKRQRMS